jgi:hypothetical protein
MDFFTYPLDSAELSPLAALEMRKLVEGTRARSVAATRCAAAAAVMS